MSRPLRPIPDFTRKPVPRPRKKFSFAGHKTIFGTRALANAYATNHEGTPKLSILGVRALASAVGKLGTPGVIINGVRAAASAAGKAGTPKVSILGTRGAANTNHADFSFAEQEIVTLTSGLDVLDGTVTANGKLLGITTTTSTPATIVKWADPYNDVSTYTTQAYTNDGKHIGAASNCIAYDSGSDRCYVVHTSYITGGFTFAFVISRFDPDDITTIATVVDYDTGLSVSQGQPALVFTGGFLYVLTAPSSENARIYKIDPSDGSVDASMQFTGTDNVRGHGFTTDGTRLYVSGNKLGTPRTSWCGWAELDLSAWDSISLGSGVGASDDMTTIGNYFYVNVENESVPSGIVKKVAKDLSSVTDIPIGFPHGGVDGQYYDGTYLWVGSNGETGRGNDPSALVAIEPATGNVLTSKVLSFQKVNEIFRSGNTVVLVTYSQPAQAARVSLSAASGFPAGSPKISVTGVRAGATAAGKPGTVSTSSNSDKSITGVRATATATAKPGTPKIAVTGARALATATGKAGNVAVARNDSVTGVRATATATAKAGTPKVAVTGVRAAASAAGKAGTPWVLVTGARATATATANPGAPSVNGATFVYSEYVGPVVNTHAVTGVRALATATAKIGVAQVIYIEPPQDAVVLVCAEPTSETFTAGSGNRSVTGVRALATAIGKAGCPKVSVTGVRATATATGRTGTPRVAVTGTRAAATATGKAGTPKVAVTAARALAAATGKAGTVTGTGTQNDSVTGVRALATATGKPGTPKIAVTGTRAATSATAKAGTPKVAVTGARALATATGKAGSIAGARNDTVTGVRATATATGRAGTPKVAVTGTRATATAAGRAGTPKVAVTGLRALATATGKAGSVANTGPHSVTGARGLCTATGKAGTPKVSVSGIRGACAAAGRTGTPKVAVTGTRGACSAAGRTTIAFTIRVSGSRGSCTAAAKPGIIGTPGRPKHHRRTRITAQSGFTMVATTSGRTNGRTRINTQPVVEDE